MSIFLPAAERRAALRSFVVVTTAFVGLVLWLVAWWIGQPDGGAVALALSALVGWLGWSEPDLARKPYRGWNRFVVRPFERFATDAIVKICFFVVFAVARRLDTAGSANERRRSRWQPRRSVRPDEYQLTYTAPRRQPVGTGWIRAYVRWAIDSGNGWSVMLVPFLVVLAGLCDERRQTVEANIYTLF